MKKTILIVMVALFALAGGMAVRGFLSPLFSTVASPLPEFSFPDLSGRQHSISEWKGKVLVINFWATWCPSCKEEIPDFVALQKAYADKGLQVIGISIEEPEPVGEYLEFVKINYPVLIAGDPGMILSRQLGNLLEGVPYTVVVDQQGTIVETKTGKFPKQKLVEIVTPLLK
ncbi:MAG: TlpA family protein disulfide reductase [Gammaproteobacteria bacterium]